mgnify:CR=1 FL=1
MDFVRIIHILRLATQYSNATCKLAVEFSTQMNNLLHMEKQATSKTGSWVRRDGRSGQFIGHAEDGTAIAKPAFKPESFTLRELRKVIRAVRDREQTAKAG